MWELRLANPFGRLSIRNMLMFAASILAASLAFIILSATPAHAADAGWSNDNITYDGHQYIKQSDVEASNDPRGFPKGTHVYSYIEPQGTGTNATQKAHLIYFDASTDPIKAQSANYVIYDFTGPDGYKNPTDKKTVSISPRTAADTDTTSCVIEGIGWIVCPVTNFLADAMDWLFGILSDFLAVHPVTSEQDNSLYRAWSIMRNFANVAFVIGFLVIIYSQVSSIGLSNYGIKKLLPRLVVAAVLVNISYWICAIAVDVSNILGYSLQDLFMGIRNNITGTNANHWDVGGWKSITTAILSGGTLATAGVLSIISVGSIAGAVYMLLPVLVGILIAALVAIVIMAARQALIVILIIVAPLAFVAYLLPNTEKYFDKWQDTLTTMLVLFPIFAVLFGGAQLAGTAIIQNANSIIMLILGMATQVAPLVILPFMIKFSGSLIGRIAGMANDKSKGLIDRTRKFSQDQADLRKSQILARENVRRRNLLTRGVQGMNRMERKREGWKKANEGLADAQWANSEEAHKIHAASARATLIKEIGEAKSEAHVEALKRTNATMQDLDLRARAGKLDVDLSKAKVNANWEEFKAGDSRSMVVPEGLSASALANYAHERQSLAQSIQQTARDTKAAEYRAGSAEQLQSSQITDELLKNTATIDGQTLREYGGGVLGKAGAGSVFASAAAKHRSDYAEKIKEKVQLFNHFNVDSSDRQKLAMGKDIPAEKNGISYVFSAGDDYAREAAIDVQLQKGSFTEIQSIIRESGENLGTRLDPITGAITTHGTTYKYRTSISDAIKNHGLDKKAIFWGSQSINDIAQGKMNGNASFNMAAARSLAGGKVSDDALSSMNFNAIERLFDVTVDDLKRSEDYIKGDAAKRTKLEADFTTSQEELTHSAWRIMHTPVLSRNADKFARDILEDKMRP